MSKSSRHMLTYGLLCLCFFHANAQDLDPRAYVHLPVSAHSLFTGYSFSTGSVVTDPTLPITNLNATVHSASLAYAQTFGLFKQSAQVLVALPYSFANATGEVFGVQESISRSGLGDGRIRLSVLFLGAPALGVSDFVKAPKKTILGASITITAPTGQFFSNKLINIGTNRWSIKPELALSQPLGKRWLFDAYAGVWFFTTNYSFYPGTAERAQKPMGAFQAHLSYNITPRFWVAANTTFYAGGESTINDSYADDRQSNMRIGLTAVVPVGKRDSIKLAASTGAVVRVGQDFSTFSIGWQHGWFGKSSNKP
jgi:hypothetical protein